MSSKQKYPKRMMSYRKQLDHNKDHLQLLCVIKIHGPENTVVLISYPRDGFHNPKALRAFISTDASLSTREILETYVERWQSRCFFARARGN